MSFKYYLVSYSKGTKQEIATSVYEADEATARVIGAALLTEFYNITITSEEVDVEEVSSLTSDEATTT